MTTIAWGHALLPVEATAVQWYQVTMYHSGQWSLVPCEQEFNNHLLCGCFLSWILLSGFISSCSQAFRTELQLKFGKSANVLWLPEIPQVMSLTQYQCP